MGSATPQEPRGRRLASSRTARSKLPKSSNVPPFSRCVGECKWLSLPFILEEPHRPGFVRATETFGCGRLLPDPPCYVESTQLFVQPVEHALLGEGAGHWLAVIGGAFFFGEGDEGRAGDELGEFGGLAG